MDNATLAFCILIQRRERDRAIGLKQDTQHLRGLSAYVRHSQRADAKGAIEVIVEAAWHKAMIEELTSLADRLVDHITGNIEDDETRRDGLEAMTKLESYIAHLGNELEAVL